MDCHAFHEHHVAYLDGVLPEPQRSAVERHVLACSACAGYDTSVRRALLLARNLPPIECSPDFAARLEARLRDVAEGRRDVPMDWREQRALSELLASSVAPGGLPRRALLAAGMLAMLWGTGEALDWGGAPQDVVLPPVVATRPAPPPAPALADPTLLTTATAGIPVWTAALLADQAPAAFVAVSWRGGQ